MRGLDDPRRINHLSLVALLRCLKGLHPAAQNRHTGGAGRRRCLDPG